MYKGSLVTIDDLSNGQIEDILNLAEEIQEDRPAFYGLASRFIMASLFLEPSTRTRGSFEAAMKRLGGDAITTADATSSSMEKGESLADAVRIWSGYSDLIVLRHPWEGAARLAAEYSDVPVINAGDGSHEHPTQTLLDLYTLRKEFGTLEGLRIILCGDLKNGRTVHSLTYALLRFGAEIFFMSGEGLELPQHVRDKIETVYGRAIVRVDPGYLKALYSEQEATDGGVRLYSDEGATDGGVPQVDAVYMTPSQPHIRALYEDESEVQMNIRPAQREAIYVTRWQRERRTEDDEGDHTARVYPRVTRRSLAGRPFERSIVLHPLPRVDELSADMDSDSRSKYFQQARNGVPVRMALVALMLGLKSWRDGSDRKGVPPPGGKAVSGPEGVNCGNPGCVTQKEPQNVAPEFTFLPTPRVRFVCSYCERENFPAFYRYPWGEVYRRIEEFPSPPLDPSRTAFFLDEANARASGLRLPKKSTGNS